MADRNHIVVTKKGIDLQYQVLKETSSTGCLPKIQSNKEFNSRHRRQKSLHSSMTSAELLASYTLPRAGYFGPKEQTVSRANPDQHYHFYPNYLQKSPKEYPQRHFCVWKSDSTTKGIKDASVVVPKGKYVHHSFYNYALENKLTEDPSVEKLNRLNYHKGASNIKHLEDELSRSRSRDSSGDARQSMWMDNASRNNSNILNMSRLGHSKMGNSLSVGRFQYSILDSNKEEKKIRRYLEHEKEYDQLLSRFAEETKKSLTKYLESPNDSVHFMKTMKDAEGDIERLKGKKSNESQRLMKRLKDFQTRKYSKAWNEHNVQTLLPKKEKIGEPIAPAIVNVARESTVKEKPTEVSEIVRRQTTILNEISARSGLQDKTPMSMLGRSPTRKFAGKELLRFNSKKTDEL